MKKVRIVSVALLVALLLTMLVGCGCEHEWADANCQNPKTCKLCGKKEGEPTDVHTWEEATTDAPKHCRVCGKTEGEKIQVDERFQTSKCKELFGTWVANYEVNGKKFGLNGLTSPMKLTMIFSNDGKLEMKTELQNPAAFQNTFVEFLVDYTYRQLSALGMSKSEVDAAYRQQGTTLRETCRQQAAESIDAMKATETVIYYVNNGQIFTAADWDESMDYDKYEIKGGKLLLDDKDLGEIVTFTRVA